MKTELKKRLQDFMEQEARSCSCITPEYVFRMWGGQVPLNEIEEALKSLEFRV